MIYESMCVCVYCMPTPRIRRQWVMLPLTSSFGPLTIWPFLLMKRVTALRCHCNQLNSGSRGLLSSTPLTKQNYKLEWWLWLLIVQHFIRRHFTTIHQKQRKYKKNFSNISNIQYKFKIFKKIFISNKTKKLMIRIIFTRFIVKREQLI